MSNVLDYVDYFRQLAIRHKDLQHDPHSETGNTLPGSKHFTKCSVEEVVSGLRSEVGWPCLMLELFETDTESESPLDVRQRTAGAFLVMDHPSDETFEAEMFCYHRTELIVTDLLRQVWQDHYSPGVNRCNTPFKEFSFDKLTITPVGPLFNGEFGYRVEFNFELQKTLKLSQPPAAGAFAPPTPRIIADGLSLLGNRDETNLQVR